MSAKSPKTRSVGISLDVVKETVEEPTKLFKSKSAEKRSGGSAKEAVKLPSISPPSPTKKTPDSPIKATSAIGAPVKKASVASPPPVKLDANAAKNRVGRSGSPGKAVVSIPPLDASVRTPTTQAASAGAEIDIVPPQLIEDDSPDDHQAPTTGTAEATSPPVAASVDVAELAALSEAHGTPASADSESGHARRERGNGMVKLVYEQYDDEFAIADGSTTQANIDDVYCLSFVMPECQIRLSRHPNAERFAHENAGIFDSLVPEDPRGVYHELERGATYYVVVEQNVDQLRRDQEATRTKWEPELQQHKRIEKDDGRGFETCSCIYGNPCADEYGCKDWHARFAVATANGWKGF